MGAEISTKSFDARIREDCTADMCRKMHFMPARDRLKFEKLIRNSKLNKKYYYTQLMSVCNRLECYLIHGDIFYTDPTVRSPVPIRRGSITARGSVPIGRTDRTVRGSVPNRRRPITVRSPAPLG